MGKDSGGSTNTVVSQSGPPQAFLDAYQNVVNRAQTQSQVPLEQYQGDYLAGFTPDQLAAFGNIRNAAGQLQNFGTPAQPFIDQASQAVQSARNPLWENVQQFSPGAVNQYMSPYQQQVIDATQAQFDVSNQRQQDDLVGKAISAGAFGGDRAAVAQAALAGEQQRNQAPIIADLYNKGYGQALDMFRQQQQQELGADQANAWLNMQGAGALGNLCSLQTNANLGGINASLSGSNALLGIGGAQQAQEQAELNIPYQEFIQRQQYPYQQIGWLGGVTGGLGSAAGGNSTTSYPAPSALSQVAGLGMTGLGIVGGTGGFGANGWLTNMFGSGGGGIGAGAAGAGDVIGPASSFWGAPWRRGGRVDYADGGIVVPFPRQRRAHGGRLPFGHNDNHEPQRQRATGTYAPGGIVVGPIPFAEFGGDTANMDTGKAEAKSWGEFGRAALTGLAAISGPVGFATAIGLAKDGKLGTSLDLAKSIADNFSGGARTDPFSFHDPVSFGNFGGYDNEGRGPSGGGDGPGSMSGPAGDPGANGGPSGPWKDGGVVTDDTDKTPEPPPPVYRPDPSRIRKPVRGRHYLDQYPPAATIYRADGGIVHRADGGGTGEDWTQMEWLRRATDPSVYLRNPQFSPKLVQDEIDRRGATVDEPYRTLRPLRRAGVTGMPARGQPLVPVESQNQMLPPMSDEPPFTEQDGGIPVPTGPDLPMPPTPRPMDGGVASFTPTSTGEDVDLPMPPTPRPDEPTDGGVVAPRYGVSYEAPGRTGRADEMRKGAIWDTLTEAGLATMAGTSPHALVNIGRGGQRGTAVARDIRNRADAVEAREAQAADVGSYRKSTLEQQAQRMSDAADEARKRIQMQTKHYADQAEHQHATRTEQSRHNKAVEQTAATQAAKGYLEPVRALENEDGTPQTDENGVPLGIWKDRYTGKETIGALADPSLRSRGAQGTTVALAKQLIADGAAKDMQEALRIIRDPSGKNAATLGTAQERLALQAAKADPDYQSDSKATIERWRTYYGLTGKPGGAGGTAMPKTKAEFDALPSGALYINPSDGQTFRKK